MCFNERPPPCHYGDNTMTPAQIKAISQNTGLSWREMARICRVNESTIRKAAAGVYPLSGPCAMILDMLDRGELPNRFYST